ncbi:MAG: hypothetical protein BroJett025_02730 [Patescibacteria group bacterium]|nr:MAG: hypothetical protein BroJett025_02730 [Patescibacteria group bacterium]
MSKKDITKWYEDNSKKGLERKVYTLENKLIAAELHILSKAVDSLVERVHKTANSTAGHARKPYGAIEKLILYREMIEAIARTYRIFFFQGLELIGLDPIEELKKEQKKKGK